MGDDVYVRHCKRWCELDLRLRKAKGVLGSWRRATQWLRKAVLHQGTAATGFAAFKYTNASSNYGFVSDHKTNVAS